MSFSFLQPPEFLTLPIFGLDISPSSIKLARLKNNKVGHVPYAIDEIELFETCSLFTGSKDIGTCDEVKKALLLLKKKHKIEFVRISIPEEKTYVFRVLIPRDALHSVDEYVLYNLDQYVPIESSDAVFDYKVLAAPDDAEKVPVVITVIPKNIIEQYTDLVNSCEITIVAYEPEAHAVARSIIDHDDDNPYIVINVDHEVTTISIVEEGFVQYTQTLPVSKDRNDIEMSQEDLLTLKENIRKVIIYWFTSKDQKDQNLKIENIVLTGDAMNSPNVINFLESNLSVNAKFGNVWTNCFALNEYVPKISKKESLKYATCIGLCISTIK